jgi:YesN/AraC family two-component response regulator
MPTSAAAIESNPMTRALRIVVADDEPVMLDYFQRMLPWLGYEVVAAAANGRELVELCHEKKPDLIITDVRMPDMDGDVALQQIFQDAPIPFILISAFSKLARIPDGVGSIGWAYLTKPVKREDLAEAIEHVFSASAKPG